ncbi:MAG: hypothetical protein WAK16_11030 [Candidatus Cybelea sp.]
MLRLFNRTLARPIALHMHRNHRRSWVNPDAKKTDLLYVSDEGSGLVDVYSYKTPNGKGLMGQLTGFEFPYGDCSDGAGNVYIDDFLASQVVEYAKGGTTPIKTLAVTGLPIGCSVDPATGNLAVSAFVEANPSTTCGGVWVFAGGSGTPTLYEDPNICEYWPPGYDNASNLFVEGESPNPAGIDELASGGSSFTELTLSGFSLSVPAGIMWNSNASGLAATDQNASSTGTTAIYRITVSDGTAALVSTTTLTDSCDSDFIDVVQPWVMGKKVVGGNFDCTFRFNYWNYANGGAPKKSIDTNIAPDIGSGQTVSR